VRRNLGCRLAHPGLVAVGERETELGRFLRRASPVAAPDPGNLVQVPDWSRFYDDHYHRVVRFMMQNGASLADAQDAASEAFVASWVLMNRNPDAWQAVSSHAAWVRTVALRRLARPPGPRRRPLTANSDVPDQPGPGPGHAELTTQAEAVLQALRALDNEARAVMAFYIDGFTTAETATALSITQQRVRDVRKKARAALKRQLTMNAAAEGSHP
jgi:RNA polymerase sigma factor (sigma-70 family)